MDFLTIGLDLSLTSTGVTLYRGDDTDYDEWIIGSKACKGLTDRFSRYHGIIRELHDHIGAYTAKCDGICLENYAFNSNMKGVTERIELGTLIREYLLSSFECITCEVAPTSLKLFACGRGAGFAKGQSKKAVAAGLLERYGVKFKKDDLADSYTLAKIAAALGDWEDPVFDRQYEALEKIRATGWRH